MEDVFLGRAHLFVSDSVIALRNYEAWNKLKNPCKNGLNKMVKGKEHSMHGMATAIEIVMCNEITYARA